MIKLYTERTCGCCKTAAKILEDKGIIFEKIYLEDMNKVDKDKIIAAAIANGNTALPVIMDDGKIVKLKDVI